MCDTKMPLLLVLRQRLSDHSITFAKYVYAYHSFGINSYWFIEHFNFKFVTILVQFGQSFRGFETIIRSRFESRQSLSIIDSGTEKKTKWDCRGKTHFYFHKYILNAMKGFCFRKKVCGFLYALGFSFVLFFLVCCEYRFHLQHFFFFLFLFSNWIHYDNFYFSAFISELKKETRNNKQYTNTQ